MTAHQLGGRNQSEAKTGKAKIDCRSYNLKQQKERPKKVRVEPTTCKKNLGSKD